METVHLRQFDKNRSTGTLHNYAKFIDKTSKMQIGTYYKLTIHNTNEHEQMRYYILNFAYFRTFYSIFKDGVSNCVLSHIFYYHYNEEDGLFVCLLVCFHKHRVSRFLMK